MQSNSGMPPKARILPASTSTEKNSAQKIRPSKSRSKERRSNGGPQISGTTNLLGGLEGSKVNLNGPRGTTTTQESASDLTLFRQIDTHEMSLQQNHNFTSDSAMGSGLKQPRMKKMTSHGQKLTQNPLQIPSQRPIYRLLQTFKLQQYAKNFVEQGFGDEIYKLTMITHRKKQELIDSIELLPGHKQRFIELFRRIENMYPRQNVQRTVDNAVRISSSKQSQSRMSAGAMAMTHDSSLNISTDATASAAKQMSIANAGSRESVQTVQSTQQPNNNALALIQTQPINLTNNAQGIHPPTQFPAKKGGPVGDRQRSPPSQGKQRRPIAQQQQSNLITKFTGLDQGTRTAINDTFLQNIRSGKSQVTTVADALKEFYGKDQKGKQSMINKIFANPTATSAQRNGIKPHQSLAQANTATQMAQNGPGGFGLGKFVKVQKGSTTIDKYRSQVSSQGSANTGIAKTMQQAKRQNNRGEAQAPRRVLDKKAKNSNSSSDSKPAAHISQYRKGSHPAQSRKKNTSTSSERKETFGLLATNGGSGCKNVKAATAIQPVLGNARQQVTTQYRQQRVTSHSRLQLKQNSNFMIAPNSSRGDFSKVSAKQQQTKNGGAASTLLTRQQNAPQGRTRLHRVRSAAGYKDVQADKNDLKDKASSNAATSTINSTAIQDYSSNSGNKPATTTSSGQQAAMKRIQLHRQRSAKKQFSTTGQDAAGVGERQSQTAATNHRRRDNKPPTASQAIPSSSNSSAAIPTFIQNNPSSTKNQQVNKTGRVQPSITMPRKQVSRDRGAQYDLGNNSGTTTDEYTGSNNEASKMVKRSSSLGVASKPKPATTEPAVNTSTISRQSAAGFTDFRLPPDSLSPSDNQQRQTGGMLPAISSTVKKVNQKADQAVLSQDLQSSPMKNNNGKPPMSSAKRSTYTSGSKAADATQSPLTMQKKPSEAAMVLTQSPDKTKKVNSSMLAGPSPNKRPLVLEPIQNPPSVEIKAENNAGKLAEATQDNMPPADLMAEEQDRIKHEENNIKWTPLIDKSEKFSARDYGYSFGSKKVSMGPGFINLRFICHCLARAIKRHLEFSKGELWFLQDLQQEQDDIDLEFSYQLPENLKLTLNPKGVRIAGGDDDDDVNPFAREDLISPVRDIETVNIEVMDAPKIHQYKAHTETNSAAKQKLGLDGKIIVGGEPEPESIDGESNDTGSSAKKVSNFIQPGADHQFSNQKQQNKDVDEDNEDIIGEELDEDEDEAYSQQEFEQEDPEEQSIKEVRREEMRKSVFEKDEKRINEYMNQRKVTELEQRLKTKDKQIAQLTKMVSAGGVQSEIMAISDAVDPEQQEEDEDQFFYDGSGAKMDRAEWLMAQVDLDPIESHGSMEMSTTKFKSLHGGNKRFLNSDGGVNTGNLESSSRSNNNKKPPATVANDPSPLLEKKKEKRSAKSYESAFVDVSEDKMREFAMTQLRHFDVRMEYDNLIFNEDQFIPMPSEKYIADYCKYVTIACKMENEIPIVCLVYLEKLLLTTGILLNKWNWKRIVLVCLCLASKIWDDDSLENVHFPKVMSDVTNYEINKLEQLFLDFIDYKLVIKGAEYAKYYFILRSMADDLHEESSEIVPVKGVISPFENGRRNQANKEEWAEFPLRAPISAEKMIDLQRQEAKAEVYLKERHEREFLNAYIGHKKDQTRHPSLLLDRSM